MKKSKFSENQIVAILKQGDAGVPVKVTQVKRAGDLPGFFGPPIS
ncbi:MAG: hypothetical protein KatS3mg082_2771 [Nitrospiraceae bacterium]|nr:MAG: hypothetical protein KatS3mg082_2771 [Nitrospiraceae bacterium]